MKNTVLAKRYAKALFQVGKEDNSLDEFNKALFAIAAYNAGPRRVADLRRKAADKGLDPDVWLDNVELIAAREIGRETVQYVANIFKYYIAYRLSMERRQERLEQKEAVR